MFFSGRSTREFGQSILIGADVRQDSKNSSRNVIYVCVLFVLAFTYIKILLKLKRHIHLKDTKIFFSYKWFFSQIDQPSLVLSRQMYVNNTEKFSKYFNAYKDLTFGLVKLLSRENSGNSTPPTDTYLNNAWAKLLNIETKIAKVCYS